MEIYWRLTPVRDVFEKQFMPMQMIGTYHWPQQKHYQWLAGGNAGSATAPVMKMIGTPRWTRAPRRHGAVGFASENDKELFVGRCNAAKGLAATGAGVPAAG